MPIADDTASPSLHVGAFAAKARAALRWLRDVLYLAARFRSVD